MSIRNLFGHGRGGSHDVGERHLADVDTRRREAVTHVLRPDSLSASPLASATRAPEPGLDAETVKAMILALDSAGALDEFVPDTADGVISAWLTVWNGRVDEQVTQQVLTSLRLAAQELENLAACLSLVRALRAELADLDHEVGNWRGVLRGEITVLPFPPADVATGAEDDLEALLSGGLLGDWGREGLDRTPAGSGGSTTQLVPVPRHQTHLDPEITATTREEHA